VHIILMYVFTHISVSTLAFSSVTVFLVCLLELTVVKLSKAAVVCQFDMPLCDRTHLRPEVNVCKLVE